MDEEPNKDGIDDAEEVNEVVTDEKAAAQKTETTVKKVKSKKGNWSPLSSYKNMAGYGILAVLIIAAGLMLFFAKTEEKAEEDAADETVVQDEELAGEEAIVDPTVVAWLGTPQEISYIPLFTETSLASYYEFYQKLTDGPATDSIKTFELGTIDGDKLYLQMIGSEGMGANYERVLFKVQGTSYLIYLLEGEAARLTGDEYVAEGVPSLVPIDGVTTDNSSSLNGLTVVPKIEFGGASFTSLTDWYLGGIYAPLFSPSALDGFTKLADIDAGTLYEKLTDDEDGNGVKSYSHLLYQPSGTYVEYFFLVSDIADDYSLTINWTGGSSTTKQYQWHAADLGCGSGDSVNVLSKAFHKDLIEKGTTASGNKVYTLNSKDHVVVKEYYEMYQIGRTSPISIDQFYADNILVAVKNELDYFVLLVDQEYQPQVECAKPVIYLYPETPQIISVEVGADITKSEPLYDGGWTVLALPSGMLVHKTGVYNSLFWDGTGYGLYPDITEGRVVKSSEIEATLLSQTKALGLNDKEQADFMEYWLPLMPKTAYTRLTWFGTDQMNRLAPLKLSVTPDTLIRIFLDFKGIDRWIDMPPQELTTIPRQGFTVVEWGGLKIGN